MSKFTKKINNSDQETKNTNYSQQTKSFDDMELKEDLLRGIYSYGFEHPARIQALTIPLITKGRDVIAQSQAGTGKTGAFVIGMLNVIDEKKKYPQVIIMSNTRELADQINGVVIELGKYMNVTTTLAIGGISVKENIRTLKYSQVIVGTPGRIKDLLENNDFDISKIKIFIIDEADELLQKDFLEQTKSIIKCMSKNTQMCIFSATLPDETLETTKYFMQNPEILLIKKEELSLDLVTQYYINVEYENGKLDTIIDLYNKLSINQCIIYVNSVNRAEWLREKLTEEKHVVEVIHSKLNNNERIEIMKRFRKAEFRVLIATDLMCRGIDVQHVSYILNYDLPQDITCYIHRIGRSGRYGKKGIAINLVTRRDLYLLKRIQSHYATEIAEMPEPDVINSYLTD